MSTYILGISAFYHDSAAALLRDGEIVAAAQEERFTRKKHDPAFPKKAVEFCFEQAGITAADVDFVAFYDKPILKFHRLLETYLAFAPVGLRSFRKAIPVWLGEKLHMRRIISKGLGHKPKNRYVFPEHHESHAASAFYPVAVRGGGDRDHGWRRGVGHDSRSGSVEGNKINARAARSASRTRSGCSTRRSPTIAGFKVNSGEYKLMGLAPYGEPRFVDRDP